MLFLDTCTVEAYSQSDTASGTFTITLYPNAIEGSAWADVTDFTCTINMSGSHTNTNSTSGYSSGTQNMSGSLGTSYIRTSGSYNSYKQCFDFDGQIPIGVVGDAASNFGNYIGCNFWGLTLTPSVGYVNTPYLEIDGNNKNISIYKQKSSILWYYSGTNYLNVNPLLKFKYTYYTESSSVAPITVTFNYSLHFDYYDISEETYQSASTPVSDKGTENAVEEGNEIAEDTNTKITDFFGSFFDNLLHIFVPEDGYFSEWFDKVNELLSEKLGMLYAPFDLVISTLQAIYSADSTETGIPFPGIKWEDTWLVEPFTFTFASLGDSFDDLRDKVYFATDTVLVLTFLMLLQSKVKLILEGHE